MDLRTQPRAELVARAEQALGARLMSERGVCKRRSLGLPTDRDTWVRLSVAPAEAAAERCGLEATAALPRQVRHPWWYQGTCWRDGDLLVRVEETELVTEPVICSGGVVTTEPELGQGWWQHLVEALTALSTVPTSRVATPHTRPITQQRVTSTIQAVFPEVETTVAEWTVAHADVSWVNLTAPGCRILDWEDFGLAPRGWDAATLWVNSLAAPALAEQVQQVFAADLESRTGQLSQLHACAELITAGEDYAGPLAAPVRNAADGLVTALNRREP
ncbi:hypothetical protein [Actinopolyspora mortivallis]|uniref:hypothetical protein n=1 Tax=Actinopolyspora mortivallis TaxID=33906 RepID=UPI0011B250DF|nr:hypothetical protein [Actinopolyspora mortivallis]